MNPFNKRGLGRGLSSLIGDSPKAAATNMLSISEITRNRHQPRKFFNKETLEELTNSIKEKVYQTIVPRNVRLSEAPSHGLPVLMYDKNCQGSKSYLNFTEEFIIQEKILESAA